MKYESLETILIRQQNQYIQQLEQQLGVYEEKDKVQEELILNLNNALELLSGELSRVKAELENEQQKEK
ncbi:MAG: hypothetical protein J5988_13660 [Eubacterium sp.]|nr:hypothetical protein [Eubacterium sp.]